MAVAHLGGGAGKEGSHHKEDETGGAVQEYRCPAKPERISPVLLVKASHVTYLFGVHTHCDELEERCKPDQRNTYTWIQQRIYFVVAVA